MIHSVKKNTEHALPSETPAETKTKINTIAEKRWLRKQNKNVGAVGSNPAQVTRWKTDLKVFWLAAAGNSCY